MAKAEWCAEQPSSPARKKMSRPLLITTTEIRNAIYLCDRSFDQNNDYTRKLSDDFHYMLATKMVQNFHDNIMKFWNVEGNSPEQKLQNIKNHYQLLKDIPGAEEKTRAEYRNLNALLSLFEVINAKYTTLQTNKTHVTFDTMRSDLFFYDRDIINDGVAVDFDSDAYVTAFAQYYYNTEIADVTFNFKRPKTNTVTEVSLHQLILTGEILIHHVNYYFYKQSLDLMTKKIRFNKINKIGEIEALPILKECSAYFQKIETMRKNAITSNQVPTVLIQGCNFRLRSFYDLRLSMTKRDDFLNGVSIVLEKMEPKDLKNMLEYYMQIAYGFNVKTSRWSAETLLNDVYDKIMSRCTPDYIYTMLQSEPINYESKPDIILMEFCLYVFFQCMVDKKNFVSYFETNYISKSATETTFTHSRPSFADDEASPWPAQEQQQPPPPPSVAQDVHKVAQERSEPAAHPVHFGSDLASLPQAQNEAGTGQERS